MLVITLIIMLLIAVGGITWVVYRSKHITENFEQERPCRVYYLDNIDAQKRACDAGYFDEHPVILSKRILELQSQQSQDPQVAQRIQDMTVARNAIVNGSAPACKFEFPGWNEISDHPVKNGFDVQGNTIRNGSTASGQPNPKSDHWAFCYRSAAGYSPTMFQNTDAVVMNDGLVDGDTKYRINFHYLDYDRVQQAACKMSTTALGPNVPSSQTPGFIKFQIGDFTKMSISKVGLVINDGNGRLIPDDRASSVQTSEEQQKAAYHLHLQGTVYQAMFEVQQTSDGASLVLVPKDRHIEIYKLRFDKCNGIVVEGTKALNFGAFVKNSLGIQPKVIMALSEGLRPYAKNVNTLDTRINELTVRKNTLELEIATLAQTIANHQNTVVFKPGLKKIHYEIPYQQFASNNWWSPNANVHTREGMEAFRQAVKNLATQTGTVSAPTVITSLQNSQANSTYRRFFEYEGFVYLNAGTHRIKLNSDDAGYVMLSANPYAPGMTNNDLQPTVLVSTHYGMHGMDNRGSTVTDFVVSPGRQGYYKIFICWFEWHGGDGFNLWYAVNNFNYSLMNNGLFYYDSAVSTALEETQKSDKEREVNTVIQPAIDELTRIRRFMKSSIRDGAIEMMGQVVGKLFPQKIESQDSVSFMSNDGAYYIWPGEIGVPLRPNATAPTDAQFISDSITDITSSSFSTDPFVINVQQPPEYTVMMWIKVHQRSDRWRPLFLHGVGDRWPDTDRTPGVWITHSQGNLNDGKVRVHFRHRAKGCVQFDNWRIHGGDHNCGLDVSDASKGLPAFGQWFHFAATIRTLPQYNASEIAVYVNGVVHDKGRLTDHNKFDWNQLYGKRLFVGSDDRMVQRDGPIHIQKAKWYSVAKTPTEIASEFQQGYVSGGPTPYAPPPNVPQSLTVLFRDVSTEGTYYLRIGAETHTIYAQPASAANGNQQWMLIFNYNRVANDTKAPLVRRNKNNKFPQSLGTNDEAWGQAPKEILNSMTFSSVRFFAQNQDGKIIHFITRDPRVINYIKTGNGQIPIETPNWYTLLADHNSSIPQNATSRWTNQGDWALNYAPFYIGSSKHWDAGLPQGNKLRWEVDDYPNNNSKATIHQVWVGM